MPKLMRAIVSGFVVVSGAVVALLLIIKVSAWMVCVGPKVALPIIAFLVAWFIVSSIYYSENE